MKLSNFTLFAIPLFLVIIACSGESAKDKGNDKIRVSSIGLEPAQLTISAGQERNVQVIVRPRDAWDHTVYFTCDNLNAIDMLSNIAYWIEPGYHAEYWYVYSLTVMARQPGNAVITATSKDGGKIATCDVTVVPSSETAESEPDGKATTHF